jgi:hypothetical protein
MSRVPSLSMSLVVKCRALLSFPSLPGHVISLWQEKSADSEGMCYAEVCMFLLLLLLLNPFDSDVT